MKENNNICKLCKVNNKLENSHVIQNAIFKKIFKNNSGKSIELSNGKEDIKYNTDSWATYQLCKNCEQLLNQNYEQYSLNVLRGKLKRKDNFQKKINKLIFKNIDQKKLILYFLSIYWRAVNSSHEAFRKTKIISKDEIYIRNSILNNDYITSKRFSIYICKVIDKSGGFTNESLKEFILSPFHRIYGERKIKNISICFMFEGFFIEIYLKGLSNNKRKSEGILDINKKDLIIPYKDIFEIKEIKNLLLNNYIKYKSGKTRIKRI